MNKSSRIYIAGHTGFIGSAVLAALKRDGYNNLIYKTHKELDLTNQEKVNAFFKRTKPEYVFLLAALVGGIYANSIYPADFICQNFTIQTNVINAAYIFGAKKLIFPGSDCMYPKACPQPMKEEYLLSGPIEPTNEPFAVAKIAGIKMCQAYNRQYKAKFICCVPATGYGSNDRFGPNSHVISGLIERIHNAKVSGKKEVVVWGSGKPKREFIYVDDIVSALIFLMQKYEGSGIMHIGTGKEISIRSLARYIKEVIGFKGRVVFDTTKPDGNLRRLLDSQAIKKLGWNANIDLLAGLQLTYRWYKTQAEQKVYKKQNRIFK